MVSPSVIEPQAPAPAARPLPRVGAADRRCSARQLRQAAQPGQRVGNHLVRRQLHGGAPEVDVGEVEGENRGDVVEREPVERAVAARADRGQAVVLRRVAHVAHDRAMRALMSTNNNNN